MTDEEIIKALECCKVARLNQDCLDLKCPFSTEYGCNIDEEDLRNEALDLINRKDAEIERLKKILENRGEICKVCEGKYTEKIKHAKAKAIKEFAEKLTDRICENVNRSLDNPDGNNYYPIDVYRDIDNLVKEMVGVDNE